MSFGVATVVTNVGMAIAAKRMVGSTPSQAEPKALAVGTGATGASRTANVNNTQLSSEVEARANGGTTGTITTSVANDTYFSDQTISVTGSRAFDEAGLFDTATGNTGNMFVSMTFNQINLVAGDKLECNVQVQFS